MDGDGAYFEKRAREERNAAEQTANPQAKAAHLKMAKRYTDLAGKTADRSSDADPLATI